ncbi:nitrilase-related carbon-nitrogen hydrolase [Paracoccus albus]|uniref:nitrilase-related carbon-nitrogen hydrolase n=1 Tax=Paracoccus albus TaxID=3017784 RepID=UPI0022F0AC68|nr:nitrilase-related carbon-nitrogen hydrolase [Paracoccus albus]WBU61515.1 nitrilase [Paracoccus albus]
MSQQNVGLSLAVWQAESAHGDRSLAFHQIARAAEAAGIAGASVITFPELFISGYDRDDLGELAMTQQAMLAQLAPVAQKAGCAICTGYPERLANGIGNSAICVGADGSLLANHRKIQLFGAVEAARFVPGDCYTTFILAGKKAAILICYDVEFAPHIAALQAQGVEVILVPTANMKPFTHVGQHVIPAMAANHALSIVYANYCGLEGDLTYFGESLIAGADGQVLARAGERPAMLMATLPDQFHPGRLSTQARDLRQPFP